MICKCWKTGFIFTSDNREILESGISFLISCNWWVLMSIYSRSLCQDSCRAFVDIWSISVNCIVTLKKIPWRTRRDSFINVHSKWAEVQMCMHAHVCVCVRVCDVSGHACSVRRSEEEKKSSLPPERTPELRLPLRLSAVLQLHLWAEYWCGPSSRTRVVRITCHLGLWVENEELLGELWTVMRMRSTQKYVKALHFRADWDFTSQPLLKCTSDGGSMSTRPSWRRTVTSTCPNNSSVLYTWHSKNTLAFLINLPSNMYYLSVMLWSPKWDAGQLSHKQSWLNL